MDGVPFLSLQFSLYMVYTSDIEVYIYIQGEKEEALSKRWEIEIHISYSGVSANVDPEGFNFFNLCLPKGDS